MQNLTRTVASFLFAALLTGVISLLAYDTARADDCVTKPGNGGHWRYRTDRVNHRKCWFVDGDTAKAATAGDTSAGDNDADAATTSQAEIQAKVQPQNPDLPASTANARAEMLQAAQAAPVMPQPAPVAAQPVAAAVAAAPATPVAAAAAPAPAAQPRKVGYMGVQPVAADTAAMQGQVAPGPVEIDSVRVKTVPVRVADNDVAPLAGIAAAPAVAPDATPKDVAPKDTVAQDQSVDDPQTTGALKTVGAAPSTDQRSGSILLIGFTLIGAGASVIVGSLILMFAGAARGGRRSVLSS